MTSRFISSQGMVFDAGSSNLVFACDGGRRVFSQPSLVALAHRKTPAGKEPAPPPVLPGARLVAAGRGAVALEEEGPNGAHWVRPVARGGIQHPMALEAVMRVLLEEAPIGGVRALLPGYRVCLPLPPGTTEAQRRLHHQALRGFGLKTIQVADAALAAAWGCGMDISGVGGSMVMDLGGGKTSIAAFTMGEPVARHWFPFGGADLDQAIARHVEERFRVRLTPSQAERVKLSIGSLYPLGERRTLALSGEDTANGVVKNFTVDDNEIRDVLVDACEPLVMNIQQGFEQLSPELAADIVQKGVVMVGGGALMPGLPEFLHDRTGIRFAPAADPVHAIIQGGVILMEQKRPA